MTSLPLTASQVEQILDEAKAEVVNHLLTEYREKIQLVSKSQAAGLLDVDSKTLDSLPIPRVVLAAKKKISYRLSDIKAYIEANLER